MHSPHTLDPRARRAWRSRRAFSLIELLVSLVIFSVAMAAAMPTITSGQRLERANTAKLAQYDTARPVFDLLHQQVTRTGKGIVAASSTALTWRSADDTRKRCSRIWLDGPSKELRYQTATAAPTAADPVCPSGTSHRVLARGITLGGGTPLYRYEDEPGVASPAGQETIATRVLVGFAVAEGTELPKYRERAITVGR